MYVSVDSQLEVSGPETRPMKVKDISALVQQTVDVDTLSKELSQSPAMHDEKHDRPRKYPWLAASQRKCPAVGVPEP